MISIRSSVHARDRYRERVDPTAEYDDVCWAAVEGRGVATSVAMALVGRNPDAHQDGDRFVVTPCGRAMLVISGSGMVITVVELALDAQRVLEGDGA